MTEIIVTSKTDLEKIVTESVAKAFEKQGEVKHEPRYSIISLREAADFLQLAPQTLYGFTSKRKIPFIKKGKKLYFKQQELEKWLEGGRKKSKAEIEKEIEDK